MRGAARPPLTQSSEEVEAIDVFRSIDLLRGPSGAPSDPTVTPDARQQIRNLVGIGIAVAAAVKKFETINFLASYGYEPDFLPVAGSDELQISRTFNDHLAVGAFTVDAIDADPAGTSGLDGHLALSVIYLPSFRVIPHPLFPEFPTCWHFADRSRRIVHQRAVHGRARGAGRHQRHPRRWAGLGLRARHRGPSDGVLRPARGQGDGVR